MTKRTSCLSPRSAVIGPGCRSVVEGMEVGLAHHLVVLEDEVLGQAAAMGIEDVLEATVPVPREELVVVAPACETEEAHRDELRGHHRHRAMEQVIAVPHERMPDDADLTLLHGSLCHAHDGAGTASHCLGQIVH